MRVWAFKKLFLMQFIYDYKNNQMESSLGKKSVSSLK
jgi:hypothetical protein